MSKQHLETAYNLGRLTALEKIGGAEQLLGRAGSKLDDIGALLTRKSGLGTLEGEMGSTNRLWHRLLGSTRDSVGMSASTRYHTPFYTAAEGGGVVHPSRRISGDTAHFNEVMRQYDRGQNILRGGAGLGVLGLGGGAAALAGGGSEEG